MRLDIAGLRAGYRGGTVLADVSLSVPEGRLLAVLGRNGVGKTTLVHTVMGMLRPTSGSVRVNAREVAGARPDVIARAGVGLVPQGRRVFGPLTVKENLLVAAGRRRIGPILDLFPALAARSDVRADRLSGGEQQMLAIGRALATGPRLLLMDEPSEGLAPFVLASVERIIAELVADGVTVLMVEQALRTALELADDVVVLGGGRIAYAATGAALRSDAEPVRRLLGVPTHTATDPGH